MHVLRASTATWMVPTTYHVTFLSASHLLAQSHFQTLTNVLSFCCKTASDRMEHEDNILEGWHKPLSLWGFLLHLEFAQQQQPAVAVPVPCQHPLHQVVASSAWMLQLVAASGFQHTLADTLPHRCPQMVTGVVAAPCSTAHQLLKPCNYGITSLWFNPSITCNWFKAGGLRGPWNNVSIKQ